MSSESESHLPTIRQLDDAPERSVLCVLVACAHSAERMVMHEHPDLLDFGDLRRDEPPPTPPAIQVAANLLLGDIAKLKQSLALYEASLSAAVLAERCRDLPF